MAQGLGAVELASGQVGPLPELPQGLPGAGVGQAIEHRGQPPAQAVGLPGIGPFGLGRQLPQQPAQMTAAEVEVDAGADAQPFADRQGQPAAHGIGAHQHLLRLDRIRRP